MRKCKDEIVFKKVAERWDTYNNKLNEDLLLKIKKQIKENASPRHVPAKIICVLDLSLIHI